MIKYESLYLEFIIKKGVGSKDTVKYSSSPYSYISYLRSVSKIIDSDITPAVIRSELDINKIAILLKGKRASKTIQNYCSAMRQYVAFVKDKSL